MNILIALFISVILVSCGKSPLQMKKSNDVSGNYGMESAKVFKSTAHSLTLNWLTPINSTDEAQALLIVKQNQLATDLPGDFKIFLWMPTMGHGSSPITIKKIGNGIYSLSQIYFIMDGFWQLRVQLLNQGNVTDEQIFEYTL